MEVVRHWRLQGHRYNLNGSACTRCGKVFFSPRPMCDECDTLTPKQYKFDHMSHDEDALAYEPAARR